MAFPKMNIVYDVFVKNSLGVMLPECVKELNEKRPKDPIEFISQWLYKAQDSQLYVKAKQQFLEDCLKSVEALRVERDSRHNRVDSIKKQLHDQKKELRTARQAEIGHLKYLISHATRNGMDVDPYLLQRIKELKKQMAVDAAPEKPLQITMCLPPIKGKPPQKVQGTVDEKKEDMKPPKLPFLDEITRGRQGSILSTKDKKKKKKFDPEEETESTAEVFVTAFGKLVINSPLFGTIGVSGVRTLPLGIASDNPEVWVQKGFDCHAFLEQELYTRCDADREEANNSNVKPMKLSEFIGFD